MSARMHALTRYVLAVLVLAVVASASATWSIVIADRQTHEVAVGTVTCLTSFDLLALVPVVVVGRGAGACQSAGDFDGIRRPIIFDGLVAGTSPQAILAQLAQLPQHNDRQYGIADTQGRMVTFTGIHNTPWAMGVTGTVGNMVYAIQGNCLTGRCVVQNIEAAVRDTDGDIPTRLMAGMQAARASGGDGRCSCSSGHPTQCGCPPPTFTKVGHIGGMIVARLGDTDDPLCDAAGCTDGDYLMRLNVTFQEPSDPDPVLQLQDLFDAWRASLVGRPDAIHSVVQLDPPTIPPNGTATTTMHITLLDWSSGPLSVPIQSLTVAHAPDSAGLSTIGPVVDLGGGAYSVLLTAGTATGVDRFTVTADDGIRPVVLMPLPALHYYAFGDLNCDGAINNFDIGAFVRALVSPPPDYASYYERYPNCAHGLADVNGDGHVDGLDITPFVQVLTGQ